MKALGIIFGTCLMSTASFGQIKLPGGGGITLDLGGGLDNLVKPESPLSTSPKDTYIGFPFLDGLNPDFKTLANADKTDGKWMLQPGAYRMTLHSFCGRGYAKGPSKGMGYGTAVWKGKQADILQKLLRNYDAASVPQHDAQLLIWSIIARVKPSKMSSSMQGQLAQLVEPKDIARLEGYSLDSLSDDMMAKLQGKVDDTMRPFYDAENKFRGMMYQSTQNFAEIENLMVPVDENLPTTINQGRWIPSPKGYLYRYIPHGYPKFDFEVLIPREPVVVRDDKGRITHLETADGYISEVTYEDSVDPYKFPDDPNLVAYAIKHVKYQAPGANPGDPVRTAEYDVQGCVLKGNYSGKSKKLTANHFDIRDIFANIGVVSQGGWFGHARDLYREGREVRESADSYREYYERGQRLGQGNENYENLLDYSHYRDGLREAAGGGGLGWIGETYARAGEALAAATRRINNLGTTPVDPTEVIGMPGNPGGQRALVSNRSY